jgi:hypothetical protein
MTDAELLARLPRIASVASQAEGGLQRLECMRAAGETFSRRDARA